MLCKCIPCVARGEVWINSQQTNYLVDALSEVPTLRVVNSNGRFLLTPREEQVVALVADGLTNRGVATELGLSEHTIKNISSASSIRWEFRAASNSFSTPCRTANIARCRATAFRHGRNARRTMSVCEAAGKSRGDQRRIPDSIAVPSRSPVDRDRLRIALAGAGADCDLHRSQCLLQSGRSGHSRRYRTGSVAASGLLSPRPSKCSLSALAECTWHCVCLAVALRQQPPHHSKNSGTGGVRCGDLLRNQRIAHPARVAETGTSTTVDCDRIGAAVSGRLEASYTIPSCASPYSEPQVCSAGSWSRN